MHFAKPWWLLALLRQAVLGDTVFLIGASEDERVLLIFPEEAAGEVEARGDLWDGDMVTLTGRVERMPENPEQELAQSGGLEPEVADDEVYVTARSLEETSGR